MATLGRAKKDGHLFVLLGPSKGTQQITDEGVDWLLKKGYQLLPGEHKQLSREAYRYLDNNEQLYTEGIEYTKHETAETIQNEHEAEKNGWPPLLLRLDRNYHSEKDNRVPWALTLQFDALEESVLHDLRRSKATAITTTRSTSSHHKIGINKLKDTRSWSDVSPQPTPYQIYYYNDNNQFFLLRTDTPTRGLKEEWMGNIFLRFEHPQLSHAWRRARIDEQLSIDTAKEFYWLARLKQDPEEWPGTAQKVGPVYANWQLWHLQTDLSHDSWEELQHWFSYHLLHLVNPKWRIRAISPFTVTQEDPHLLYSSEHCLLLRCDPPDQQSMSNSVHTTLSLNTVQTTSSRQRVLPLAKSNALQPDQHNYFYTPLLADQQTYRIRPQGEATGAAISVSTRPLIIMRPSWLHGLSCTLIGSHAQHKFYAFDDTPETKQPFRLHVPTDFSLEDLSTLTWKLEPTGLSCSFLWHYRTLREIRRQPSISSLSENTLSSQWQTRIWPTIADCRQATITLDAKSFGQITFILDVQPDEVANTPWWQDQYLVATLAWLSTLATSPAITQTRPVSPVLRNRLLLLGQANDLPPELVHAFTRLTTRSQMPIWQQARLQVILSKIQQKQMLRSTIEEEDRGEYANIY